MSTQSTRIAVTFGVLFMLVPITLIAQARQDPAPLMNWPAPIYWQPHQSEELNKQARAEANRTGVMSPASDVGTQAQTPANSLVFVGMNPCRVVDTRGGTGPFGGPALIGGTSRTFPIQSSATCSIPSIA